MNEAEELDMYRRIIADVDWVVFKSGRRLEQPCDQPEGTQCWHTEDHRLFDSIIEAYDHII